MKTDIEAYLRGKKWYLYLPLWLFELYAFFKILRYSPNTMQPLLVVIPQSFDFMLHEMAHIITAFLPPLLIAASGSLSEIFLGVMLIVTAFKTRGYFASVLCFLWFMLACQSAGSYMADARNQSMELVSLGGALSGSDTVVHDWNFVFSQLHLLSFDTFIGETVRVIGVIGGLVGLAFGAWLMYMMLHSTRERTAS